MTTIMERLRLRHAARGRARERREEAVEQISHAALIKRLGYDVKESEVRARRAVPPPLPRVKP